MDLFQNHLGEEIIGQPLQGDDMRYEENPTISSKAR